MDEILTVMEVAGFLNPEIPQSAVNYVEKLKKSIKKDKDFRSIPTYLNAIKRLTVYPGTKGMLADFACGFYQYSDEKRGKFFSVLGQIRLDKKASTLIQILYNSYDHQWLKKAFDDAKVLRELNSKINSRDYDRLAESSIRFDPSTLRLNSLGGVDHISLDEYVETIKDLDTLPYDKILELQRWLADHTDRLGTVLGFYPNERSGEAIRFLAILNTIPEEEQSTFLDNAKRLGAGGWRKERTLEVLRSLINRD